MNFLQAVKEGKDIDFMGLRKYFLTGSLFLLAASIVGFFNPGPRYGTDFVGGTEVEVAFKKTVTAKQLRGAVASLGFASPDVVSVADDKNPNHYLIRVKEVTSLDEKQRSALSLLLCVEQEGKADALDAARCPETKKDNKVSASRRSESVKFSPGGDKVTLRLKTDPCEPGNPAKCTLRGDLKSLLSNDILKPLGLALRDGKNNPVVTSRQDRKLEFFFKSKGDQIMDGLVKALGRDTVPTTASGTPLPLRVEWIGPKAGRQLRDAAIKSISIAILFIMAYIAFRFDMRFAPGAIVALLHDVFLALGIMVLSQREVTLSTVAALLTVVGYSINDTVVVYDRIRENLGRYRKLTFPKIINRSITEMLGRTIKTSLLTFVAVVPFVFWGTGVIKDFAFTLIVGVIVGTYSSIYIAAPLTELIDRRLFVRKTKKKRRVRRRKKKTASSATVTS